MAKTNKKKSNTSYDTILTSFNSPAGEAIQYLSSTIDYEAGLKSFRTIGFTSASYDEGRTGLVANLSYLYAVKGKKVCVIDLDFRNPHLQNFYSITNYIGAVDYVKNNKELALVLRHTSLGVDFICAGETKSLPSAILDSPKLNELFDELKRKEYEYIFVNLPPCLTNCDASIVSKYLDAYIFVCNKQISNRKDCAAAIKNLETYGCPIMGSVITDDNKNNND